MPGRLLLGFRRSPASSTASIKSKDSDDRSSISSRSNSNARSSMDHLKEIKRHSLVGKRSNSDKSSPKHTPLHTPKHTPKHSPKSSPKIEVTKSLKMNMVTESPPLVFYGTAQNSTGALFSGQVFLDVREPVATLEKFEMKLHCTTTVKKPVSQHCHDCTSQTTELKKWDFLQAPLRLSQGEHSFPFSYLLPGHLPASTHAALGSIDYHLDVQAVTTTGETITMTRPVDVRRAILPAGDKRSIRIFPPTNLTAQCVLPSVVHPIGEFPLEMRLAGITTKRKDEKVHWRLRKLVWRIEEHTKMISPACHKHAAKLGGEGKGVQHEDTRIVGQDEVKTGWKTDFDNDCIEIEFRAAVNPALKPICNVDAPNGLSISHALIVEMVIAEEWVSLKRPNELGPTGAARVLRTQFQLNLTERSGLGISWDEEQPPMYEDVPASPPTYLQVEERSLQDLGEDLEHFHLG